MLPASFTLLFWLLVGHSLCDYPLQGDFLAQAKNRNSAVGANIWKWALPAHAMIHGGCVALLTGSLVLGCLEALFHGWIDFLKCDNRITYGQDQFLHVVCKVIWVLILMLLHLPLP